MLRIITFVNIFSFDNNRYNIVVIISEDDEDERKKQKEIMRKRGHKDTNPCKSAQFYAVMCVLLSLKYFHLVDLKFLDDHMKGVYLEKFGKETNSDTDKESGVYDDLERAPDSKLIVILRP